MMKILLIHSSLSFAKCSYAGIEKMLTWLGNSLADKGYDVTFCTTYDIERSCRISTKARSIELDQPFYKSTAKRLFHTFTSVRSSLKKVLSEKYDYVVSFGDTSYLLLIQLRRKFGYKLIISERGDPYVKGSFMVNARRKLYKFADTVVFQTNGARDYFGSDVTSHSVVIANPIDIPEMEWNIATTANRIATVGRIDFYQKRQDLLIEAFELFHKEHPDFFLDIYGSGDDEGKLWSLITKRALDGFVICHGAVSYVNSHILNAKMFVLSSDFEGIPNALLEAMALGMPVVSTDCSPGGARMLINDNGNGRIVPAGNSMALAEAMAEVASMSEDALQKMGSTARKDMSNFTSNKIIEKWQEIIK